MELNEYTSDDEGTERKKRNSKQREMRQRQNKRRKTCDIRFNFLIYTD